MESSISSSTRTTLLIISSILLSLGLCGGPLVLRLYFIHGGNLIWVAAFSESAGFLLSPILLSIFYFLRRAENPKYLNIKPRVFLSAAMIGLLTGLDSYLYAYGIAHLPVSTCSLIVASQLAFTAFFSYLIVKQKFTSFLMNAIVLLTMGAGMLAMHTSDDRPKGEPQKMYIIGFVMTIGASALNGLIYPLVELTFIKSKQSITYTFITEFQMILGLFGSIFCFVGMIVSNDLKVIHKEARDFGLGETRYFLVLASSAVLWQCFTLGSAGVICYGSSIACGINIAVLLPVTEALAVVFYKEKFQAEKGIALCLSLWGFVSYFYGEFQKKKEDNDPAEIELPTEDANNLKC